MRKIKIKVGEKQLVLASWLLYALGWAVFAVGIATGRGQVDDVATAIFILALGCSITSAYKVWRGWRKS